MSTPLHLAIIIASTREGRFGPTIAAWAAREAARDARFRITVIDLATIDLPAALSTHVPLGVRELHDRLAEADAFVVVTPEYNHSFPAPLKIAIDWVSAPWQAKPVGFVSYGGASGGLRAVEQLRLVFAELHAVTVRNGVSFHGGAHQFGADGQPMGSRSTPLGSPAP